MPLLVSPPDFSLSSYGWFTNGFPENRTPVDLGTWHRTRHGSSPKEGARCQWAPEPGNLGCRRRRSPGPPGEEQFRDPPLVDACTLPAAEMPRQALRTDVRQLRSRVQAPPAASCKLPLLDRPPALFLTICALRIGQTSGLVVDQRLPSPPQWTRTLSAFASRTPEGSCALRPAAERSLWQKCTVLSCPVPEHRG